jgi:hypothetical protein
MKHRPAVIIGLGGTGQQVLTYLKAELKAENQDKMPDIIRLLCFDTMPEPVEPGGYLEHRPIGTFSYQNTKLENLTEFFGLSGNGWQIGEEVIAGRAPHIGEKRGLNRNYTWFDAPHYRQTMQTALWDLGFNRGRLRQFGRLAYFMNFDLVRETVINAVSAVRNTLPPDEQYTKIEIMVVSSVAGGTGAGMFLDMALLCRDIARSVLDDRCLMRGFVVLPTAFIQVANENDEAKEMKARSFAAWRELDRFMNITGTHGAHQIDYHASGEHPLEVRTRPFDVCYLIDSRSNQNSLENLEPKLGVMPMVAEFISLVLDEKAGKRFNSDVVNRSLMLVRGLHNRMPSRCQNPGYCTFRAFTLKVPIYFDIHGNALHFAKDLLEHWLVPVLDAETNTVKRIEDNKNQEKPNQQGRDEVLTFLQTEKHPVFKKHNRLSGETEVKSKDSRQVLESTSFISHIAEVNKLRNQPGKLINLQDEEARGGASYVSVDEKVSVGTYLSRLIDFPSDANETKIILDGKQRDVSFAEITAVAETRVWDIVPPSKDAFGVTGYGDTPMDALSRFKDTWAGIPHYERRNFGAGAGNQGRFGNILSESSAWQVARFTELLREWTASTLNGRVLNVHLGLSGKLGYVLDFYAHLEASLDFFINTHLVEVFLRRNNVHVLTRAKEDMEYTWDDMADWASKKMLIFFVCPRAHHKQRDYLAAVDYYHGAVKDDMVLETVRMTTEKMLSVVRSGYEAINQWANALVQSNSTVGLYSDINQDVEVVDSYLEGEKNQPRVKYITPEHRYQKDVNELDEVLKRIQWEVSGRGDQISVVCKVVVPTGQTDENGQVLYDTVAFKSGATEMDLRHNRQVLLSICKQRFEGLRNQRAVINQVMRVHNQNEDFQNPAKLADFLVSRSGVLGQFNPATDTQHHDNQVYLRLMDPRISVTEDEQSRERIAQVRYLNNLDNRIRSLTVGVTNQAGYMNLGSSDNHKLTIVQYIARIMKEDFSIWKELKQAYEYQIICEPNSRLHIFPAECNAVYYESQLKPVLDKDYRVFHPFVVMLLENISKLKLYFECLAYGYITEISEGKNRSVNLQVPGMEGVPEQRITLLHNDTDEPLLDAFEVIELFIKGIDLASSNGKINWSDLKRALWIRSRIQKDGEMSASDAFRFQRTDPLGIIMKLRAEAENRKSMNHTTGVYGQEFEDLADLGEIIYHEVEAAVLDSPRY